MRIVSIVGGLILSTALAGCAANTAYIRTDGQDVAGDAVLVQQFEIDQTICMGEMQKANVSSMRFDRGGRVGAAERSNTVGQIAQGCMAKKGYILVKENEAPARMVEYAAIAEVKKKRETEARPAQHPAPAEAKKKREAAATMAEYAAFVEARKKRDAAAQPPMRIPSTKSQSATAGQ
jgi:hypothetical protein